VIFEHYWDYVEFAGLLGEAAPKHGVDCFAWSLMPNHWHLLVRSPESGLSAFVQRLNHRYSLRSNRRKGRSAHLFMSRFGSVLQESEEQFLWTLRYVLRNPVEDGRSMSVRDAPWTSYGATVGRTSPPPFLRVDEVLARFGSSEYRRIRAFEAFLDA
jgi:REP element-mobilizing transposase RayT